MSKQALWRRILGWILIVTVIIIVGLVVVKLIYPLYYAQEITRWAGSRGLDPSLVEAVICTESRFRSAAVSPSGAIGLMQITPTTGRWIAEQLQVNAFAVDDLYFPETNIRFGTWYIRYLLDRFSGEINLALAAYNAGPTALTRLQAQGKELYPETATYIKRVKHDWIVYRFLYHSPVLGAILRGLTR